MYFYPLGALLEVAQPCGLRPVMCIRDEVIDLALVVVQEWLDVLAVEERGTLGPREDQVKVDKQADPGVEGYPAKNEVEGAFDGGDEREGDKVHKPWGEDGWVGGVESFIGGEDGE